MYVYICVCIYIYIYIYRRQRGKGWQRMRWLDEVTNSADMNLSKLQEIVEHRGAWHAVVHGVAKSQTRLCDWTIIWTYIKIKLKNINTTSIYIIFSIPFFSFIYIRWRLINLPYCSGFCHTLIWISHGFTCAPHLETPLPPPTPLDTFFRAAVGLQQNWEGSPEVSRSPHAPT